MLKKILFMPLYFLLIISCNNSNNESSKSTYKHNSKKVLIPIKDKIYFGAFPDFGGSEDNVTTNKIEKFEKLIEKKIIWGYFSQNWFKGIRYPKKAIHAIHKNGTIPFIRLMPRSNEKEFKKEQKFSLQNIIDGQFDKELKRWAKEAKADNIPLLMDFAVEPNGNWFGWSAALNGAEKKDTYGSPDYYDGAERYRDAYRHIIDIFKKEKVTHLTWFFHANTRSMPNKEWNKPKLFYPGDEYIDWIGVSLYGSLDPQEEYWEMFDDLLKKQHKNILEISSKKPFALLEFGVTDQHLIGTKTLWLENAFETILSNKYINFQAISYWHENWETRDNVFTTIRVDSSTQVLETFKQYIKNPKFLSYGYYEN